jgi:hypothetical protein
MSNTIENFGLIHNADYRGCQVEVKHKNGEWYPLVRVANKILYYEDYEENIRRMNLGSLEDVNYINGTADPVVGNSESNEPSSAPMVDILWTNTYYSEYNLEVNHIDKGWFPLVRTSNKMVYYLEDGKERRMTVGKVGSTRLAEEKNEPELTPFPESPDTFFDSFDYDMVG